MLPERGDYRRERLRLGSALLCWPGDGPRAPRRFATQEAAVPKSRVRKRTVYTPPPPKSTRRKVSPPWVGPTIAGSFIFGLAWIATYYITSGSFAGMSALGSWNLVIGFVFIVAGVALATTWR
jgi:hypothetical protein